jgi:hypothetical protein
MQNDKATVSAATTRKPGWFGKFPLEEIILFLILLLSIFGVAITDYAPAASWAWWIFMVVVLCVSALVIEKSLLHRKDVSFASLLFTQLIHWGGALLAIVLSLVFVKTGRLTYEGSGLVIMLILSLATFLDGYHVGWRFYLAGLFLGITTVLTAYVEEFMWILIVIAIISLLFAAFLEKHLSSRKS